MLIDPSQNIYFWIFCYIPPNQLLHISIDWHFHCGCSCEVQNKIYYKLSQLQSSQILALLTESVTLLDLDYDIQFFIFNKFNSANRSTTLADTRRYASYCLMLCIDGAIVHQSGLLLQQEVLFGNFHWRDSSLLLANNSNIYASFGTLMCHRRFVC